VFDKEDYEIQPPVFDSPGEGFILDPDLALVSNQQFDQAPEAFLHRDLKWSAANALGDLERSASLDPQPQ
jgi:hypothetical protein